MIRAKFYVSSITYFAGAPGSTEVDLHPVQSSDPEHENKVFWDATPSGRIEMLIQNPDAADQFQVGKEYYVDFTEA